MLWLNVDRMLIIFTVCIPSGNFPALSLLPRAFGLNPNSDFFHMAKCFPSPPAPGSDSAVATAFVVVAVVVVVVDVVVVVVVVVDRMIE